MKVVLFVLTTLTTLNLIQASYLPPYVEGIPQALRVVALDPPDIRKEPVYRIEIEVLDSKDGTTLIPSIIHRTYREFALLDQLLPRSGPKNGAVDPVLPSEKEANVSNLNEYLQDVSSHNFLMEDVLLHDFMGINWNGSDLAFMAHGMTGFMDMLLFERVPTFCPEPVVIDNEADIFTPETPFEAYVFFMAFRHEKENTDTYLEYFKDYTDLTPGYEGAPDDSDVWHPLQTSPIDIPYHFNKTFVHFLPGGYLNGHTVRISYLGNTKFTFLDEEILRSWLTQLYGDKNPTRILDIGTGNGYSAFVLGEMFPNAEVIGVDLAAPYIRFCNQWKDIRGATNVNFYAANAENLDIFESESFDFINYAYVLHEMPGDNAKRIINETYRLLAPGGTLNGFEVPYFSDETTARIMSYTNTWGMDWDSDTTQGPEPYTEEYEFETRLPVQLELTGFEAVTVIEYSAFESIFSAVKPNV